VKVTCPSCGADMDLDVLLAHEDSRRALVQLLHISVPLSKSVIQYLRLFKPTTRAMSIGRTVSLLEQVVPDIQRGVITHRGRDWPVSADQWREAINVMLVRRDNEQLKLPLANHNYLYEVLMGLSDKAEAQQERVGEDAKRSRAATPATYPEMPSIGQVFATAVNVASSAPVPLPKGPSRHALRVQAEIAAKKAREAGQTAAGDVSDGGSV
jgi:hypothetical protein